MTRRSFSCQEMGRGARDPIRLVTIALDSVQSRVAGSMQSRSKRIENMELPFSRMLTRKGLGADTFHMARDRVVRSSEESRQV